MLPRPLFAGLGPHIGDPILVPLALKARKVKLNASSFLEITQLVVLKFLIKELVIQVVIEVIMIIIFFKLLILYENVDSVFS